MRSVVCFLATVLLLSSSGGAIAGRIAAPEAARSEVEPMRGFSWIVEQQLAAMPRPGAARPLIEDVEFLAGQEIRLLISLTEEAPDAAVLASGGIESIHLPVSDFAAPTLEQLELFLEAAEGAIAAGRPVGVHCAAGLGRSGTFAAAFLIGRGSSAEEAMATVRRLRPGSIETEDQERRLVELGAALHTN